MGRPAKCWLVSAMLCPWIGAVYKKVTDISQQVYGVPCYYTCSSTEPKEGELIVCESSQRLAVCLFTLSNMNISAASRLITTKFYLKYHWGGGRAAIGFGPD